MHLNEFNIVISNTNRYPSYWNVSILYKLILYYDSLSKCYSMSLMCCVYSAGFPAWSKSWSASGKLPFECQKIVKNFFFNCQKIVI